MSMFFDANEVLKMAIKTEETGCEFYKAAIKNAISNELKELFSYLAREEIKHKETFEKLLGSLDSYSFSGDQAETNDYIKAMIEDSMFIGSDSNIGKTVLATDEISAVENALRFEKETLLFFYQLLEMVKPDSRSAIEAIIAEEKTHIQKLSKMKKNLSS